MALLQISEPGMSTAPHQHRLAVGIDLGTTNSLVATVRNSIPEILNDEEGRSLLPSVVRYLANGHAHIGFKAQAEQSKDPKNTIVSVKRFMGRGLKDIAYAENLPYDFHDEPGMVQLKTVAGLKSPVEISAQILATLRQQAEDALGDDLVGAVITVPAYFDDAQRQATKDAAKLAGINVLRLLNEPTAAAIAYGLDNASEGTYAVYDLGGGTFDISVLKMSKGVFEVLATGGDSALGGDDFDHRLFCWILEQAHLGPLSHEDTSILMIKAREAKEILSSKPSTSIDAKLNSGESVHLQITAALLAEMTQNLVVKTMTPCRKALRDAGLSADDIDGVVLVGGATRMPHVRKAVAEFFQTTPLANIDPDKVVALGAAIQANLLAGNRAPGDDWLLLDVIPLSLGVETMGGLAEKVIPRNSTIPCARAQEFTTFKDGQTALAIHIVQGERELVSDCRSLARFELRGIPPMAAGAARIRITYQVDADGLLSVSARELRSGVETAITVKPSYGLVDGDITRMLQDSFSSADSDMQQRALREEQVEAERILLATQSALTADRHLISAQEAATIEALMASVRLAMQDSDHRNVQNAISALAQGTDEFAQRRMDQSVRSALAGKKLDEIA
ncbi:MULTISPECIES: Fe-S protein assembly chaperone HscA [unclassified Undibacterium]|uniref:Fe-S protein assembly chaperone HscA n=1 Tax=unclassified Undibacterium TaxID=2630295 RepID=UPI002AC9A7D1|nr:MULTISPECIES: Fe-S protein assembly chaperone HscA [unclassified Undibacterium]MEB0138761.1 Fe-S protein assembly chaperone HscA [Undibacterium sp. CCC2.1]MEB0170763.1 Fe-S protein assembly chaperone HscA [Undibacterium sp. CCC1.1]MEB0174652.1 Fe-S protein assembly chaperone HscA [Undibacterium sp. CCC3.4]MEB0213849.1 Fe-S protein assembly chaperone HscA [Undibacterium sp. 5I2]WPX42575.1 Fe-S protein assembly chaperone HscA [Undibacterium sp. CCC3.4]